MTPERRAYAEKRLVKLQARMILLLAIPYHLLTEEHRKQIKSDHNSIQRWEKELAQ